MTIPAISVVMPVYNASKYLKESIDSILSQSFDNFELIIVNDGSTDNTLDIISQYDDHRIKLINNKHDFVDSLNRGMSASTGKYIARMDADDIMAKDRLQIQYDFMEANPSISICGGWMEIFGVNEDTYRTPESHGDIVLSAISLNPVSHPSVMIRSELINLFPEIEGIHEVYEREYIYTEDYKLWTVLIQKGYKFANIPQIILRYRSSDSQVTATKQEEITRNAYRIQSEYLPSLVEKLVSIDETYYDLLNESIILFNSSKLSFNEFKTIIFIVGEHVKDKL